MTESSQPDGTRLRLARQARGLSQQQLAGEPELDQLLAHAHVCRLVTEVVFRRGDPGSLETVARTSQPVTMLLMKRLAAGRTKGPRRAHGRK